MDAARKLVTSIPGSARFWPSPLGPLNIARQGSPSWHLASDLEPQTSQSMEATGRPEAFFISCFCHVARGLWQAMGGVWQAMLGAWRPGAHGGCGPCATGMRPQAPALPTGSTLVIVTWGAATRQAAADMPRETDGQTIEQARRPRACFRADGLAKTLASTRVAPTSASPADECGLGPNYLCVHGACINGNYTCMPGGRADNRVHRGATTCACLGVGVLQSGRRVLVGCE